MQVTVRVKELNKTSEPLMDAKADPDADADVDTDERVTVEALPIHC